MKKINKIVAILLFIFSIIAISIINLTVYPTSLIMEIQTEYDDTYQIFYDIGNGFNEKDSTRTFVNGEKESFTKVTFKIPKKILKLRIDPGTTKCSINIKSISLKSGLLTVYYGGPDEIERDFLPSRDIEKFVARDGLLYIKTTGKDPSFVLSKEVYSSINRQFKIYLYISVLLIALLVFFLSSIIPLIENRIKLKQYFLILVSLVPTPLILFLSSSNQLYLNNQEMLGYRIDVLLPFITLFVVVLIFGLVLYPFSKYRPGRYLLWTYFIIGPSFLFYNLFRDTIGIVDSHLGTAFFLGLSITVIIILSRKFHPSKAISFFAIFGLLLSGYESYLFVTKAELINHSGLNTNEPSFIEKTFLRDNQLPNIYHIILDEYQTDMFEFTLTPEVKKELGGFILYKNNTSNYGGTALSVPSVFTGKSFIHRSMKEFHYQAFDREQSILYALKNAGYATYAFIFKMSKFYPTDLQLFDNIRNLMNDSMIENSIGYGRAFKILWLYKNSPSFLAELLLPEEDFKALLNQKMLPNQFELLSYRGFMNYISYERYLPYPNRYTYIHILLPHIPYVLRSNCSYSFSEDGINKTSSNEQSKCTTKLIINFVKTLKELDRFKDSLIIIHADHGKRSDLSDLTSLDLAKNASRALLLMKTIGNDEEDGFVVSDFESMLLDVAPTILDSIGYDLYPDFEGISLLNPRYLLVNRKRYFSIYDAEKLVKFEIESGQYVLDDIIDRTVNKNVIRAPRSH